MFNKLKQLKDLRSQAKKMQNALADETITVEKGGIKVIMNGNLEVKSISLNKDMAQSSMEGVLTDCINEAIKKTQKIMAQKLQSMGGFPGLS